MTNPWKIVKLGTILRHRKEFITIENLKIYKRPRVQLHAKGIVLRDQITGDSIKTKSQQLCRSGEFLVAEIDAKVGGFGIVPEFLDGAIVSSHYFLFEVDEINLDRRFLDYFTRTPIFREQIEAQGSTNYASIRPSYVMEYEIPLPPLEEQRRIVARIEELAGDIAEARGLRARSIEEVGVFINTQITSFNLNQYWGTVNDAILQKKGAVRSGPFGSQLLHEEFVSSGIAAISTRDVQTNRLYLQSGWFVTPNKFEKFRRYQVFPGDILCTIIGGSIGRFCVVPDDIPLAFTTKHIQALTLDTTKADSRFVSFMLNFHHRCRESLFSQVEGSAQPSLNASKILSTRPLAKVRDRSTEPIFVSVFNQSFIISK